MWLAGVLLQAIPLGQLATLEGYLRTQLQVSELSAGKFHFCFGVSVLGTLVWQMPDVNAVLSPPTVDVFLRLLRLV